MTFISNFFDLKDLAIKNNNQTTFDKGHVFWEGHKNMTKPSSFFSDATMQFQINLEISLNFWGFFSKYVNFNQKRFYESLFWDVERGAA